MTETRLRVIVVDDEPLARALLVRLVARRGDADVVGEGAGADELPALLRAARPDVALLDIRMPGRDVFDALEAAARDAPLPAIVFATAHDEYAVRAFRLNAVDYLLKPVTDDRLDEALRRVQTRRGRGGAPEGLGQLLRDLGPRPDRLLVPVGDRMVGVPVDQIAWIQAEGDYARLHTVDGQRLFVTRSLAEIERRLDGGRFVRIHRSAIVRVDRIAELRPEGSGRYRVILVDGTALILSRQRAAQLRRWML